MKFRLARVLVGATAAFLIASAFGASPPDNFRGLRWGSAPPTYTVKYGTTSSDGTALYMLKPGRASAPFYALPIKEEAYSYTHGKFYNGFVTIDGITNFDKVRDALTKEYGPPTFTSPSKDLLRWRWPNSKVNIYIMYEKKWSRTTVNFANDAI